MLSSNGFLGMLHHETREANPKSIITKMLKPVPAVVLLNLAFGSGFLPVRAQVVEIRPVVLEKDGGQRVEYWSGNLRVGRSTEAAPAGVQLRLPGAEWAPVRFQERTERDGTVELGPTKVGALALRWQLVQKTPSLVQRTLEVHADAAQQFAIAFPFDSAVEGEYASFASCSLSGSWYCRNYEKYRNNESALPVDAHLLIALVAPRPVYVASAEQDRWADPRGEFLAARHAEPVYELLGQPGLGVVDVPDVDRPVGRTIGYHIRTGDHEITPYDWGRYLDFADQHLHQRRVLYNFDGDSCLWTKAGSEGPVAVDLDDVKRLIEEVAYPESRVDTVLVCVNAQVMYYPTKVGTMRGTLSTLEERARWPPSEKQRLANLKAFFDQHVDPYAIMLAEAKRYGREALLTFRMNDDHGNDFLRTQFLVDHPDWRLGTEQYRGLGAMDFGRDEVRDYTFRLIKEAVKRYDSDGIELDFNRFPAFFKAGTTDERVAPMNSLLERVHALLDDLGRERDRRLILGVRVPSNYGRTPPTPESARQIGCDVAAWVKHGWVDYVAISEFLYERGDLPIDKWKQVIATVPVYGGIECTRGGGKSNLAADEYRHAATQLIKAGADGVYLFNFFTSREAGENAGEPPFEVLKDLGGPMAVPRIGRGRGWPGIPADVPAVKVAPSRFLPTL